MSTTTPSSPETNPLLDKLSPRQFEASVHFYEADQKLTQEDRVEISEQLKSVLIRSNVIAYTGAVFGFIAPTVYYRNTGGTVIPGRRIHRPFGSFFIGLTCLMVGNQLAGRYLFSLQVEKNNKYQDLWKTMDYHQSGLFYLYYLRTAKDSSYILQDPRSYTEKKLHEVQYHTSQNRGGRQPSSIQSQSQTHWDKIRLSNGIGDQPERINDDLDTFNDSDDLVPSNDIENDAEYDNNKSSNLSTWDTIRKNSK